MDVNGVLAQWYFPAMYAQDTFGISGGSVNVFDYDPVTHTNASTVVAMPNVWLRGYPCVQAPSSSVLTGSAAPYPMRDPAATVPWPRSDLPPYGIWLPLIATVPFNQFPEFQLHSHYRLLGATFTFERPLGYQTVDMPYTVYCNNDPSHPFDDLMEMMTHPRTYRRLLRAGRTLRFSFRARESRPERTYTNFQRAGIVSDVVDPTSGLMQAVTTNAISRAISRGFVKAPWRSCVDYTQRARQLGFHTSNHTTDPFRTSYTLTAMAARSLSISGPLICITSPHRPQQTSSIMPVTFIDPFVPIDAGPNPILPPDGRDIICKVQIRVQFRNYATAGLCTPTIGDSVTPMIANPYHVRPQESTHISWAQLPLANTAVTPA